MSTITTWQLSQSGTGNVVVYQSEFRYAGGLVIAGFGGDPATGFAITNLGGGNIALGTTLTDQDNINHTYYLNSHYGFSDDGNNGGMLLWYDNDGYSSDSIGSEQTFRLVNLGSGDIALQAPAAPSPGNT